MLLANNSEQTSFKCLQTFHDFHVISEGLVEALGDNNDFSLSTLQNRMKEGGENSRRKFKTCHRNVLYLESSSVEKLYWKL